MKKRSCFSRIVAVVCTLSIVASFVPVPDTSSALAQEDNLSDQQERWTDVRLTDSTLITKDTVILQDLQLPDGATLYVDDSAELTIAEHASVIGNIEMCGDNTSLVNDGLIQGDVLISGAYAQVRHRGVTEGTLRVEGIQYRKNHGNHSGNVIICSEEGSSIQTLTLNGVGEAKISGHIGTLNLENGNAIAFSTYSTAQIDTANCAGDGGFIFNGGARVETMYVQRRHSDQSDWQHVDGGHIKTLYLLSGSLHVRQGATLDTAHVWGGRLSIDQSNQQGMDRAGYGTESSTAEKVILQGADVSLKNGGLIETLISYGGDINTFGRILRAALYDSDMTISRECVVEGEGVDTSPFIGYLYAKKSTVRLETDADSSVWVDTVHLSGSSLTSDGSLKTVLAEHDSLLELDPASIAECMVADSRVRVETQGIPCDEMATLTLSLSAEAASFVTVMAPDGAVHALKSDGGTEQLTVQCDEAGVYTVRLIDPTGKAQLQIEKHAPVHIDTALTMRLAVLSGEKATDIPVSLTDFDITLQNLTQGTASPVTVRDNTLYAPEEFAAPHDTLRLTLTHRQGLADPHEVDIALNAYRMAKAESVIVQRGYYEATTATESFPQAYLFDEDGRLIDTIASEDNQYATQPLPDGSYTALFIQGSVDQFKLLSLSDYEGFGLKAKRDYYLDSFTIKSGQVLARKDVRVPPAPIVDSPWIIPWKTDYFAQARTAVADSQVSMSLRWAVSGAGARPVAAEIELGHGQTPLLDSVSIDGQTVDASLEESTLRIPLASDAGEITFLLEADDQAQALHSVARLVLDVQGETIRQYVGSAATKLVRLSIEGPAITQDGSLHVYGFAAPYEEVLIYAGKTPVGVALSNKEGMWSADVRVPDMRLGDTARLTCVLYEGTDEMIVSAPFEVSLLPTAPELSQFTMHYWENDMAQTVELSEEDRAASPLRISFDQNTALTFVIRLENAAYVEAVNVVGVANGRREIIPAHYDDLSGEWTAIGQFGEDPCFAPEKIALDIALSTEAYALSPVMSTPFSQIIALDTDLLDGDLFLMRFYSADAQNFSTVGLFGQGWMSNYELRLYESQIEDTAYVALFYQGLWRIFEKERNGYVELTEYAGTLSGSSAKGFTLRETDGSGFDTDKDLRLMAVLDGNGDRTQCIYEGDRLVSLKSASGLLLHFEYSGEQIMHAYTDNRSVRFVYEDQALILVNSQWGTTSYTYASDGEGLSRDSLSSIRLSGTESQFAFDAEGRLIWTAQGGGAYPTEYLYEGDMVTVRDALGASRAYTFSEDGQIVHFTDEQNQSYDYAYDEADRLSRVVFEDGTFAQYAYEGDDIVFTNALEQITRYTIDGEGRVTKLVDPMGGVTQYRYDRAGNLTQKTYPDSSSETYAYSSTGLVTAYTDRMGQKTRYSYNRQDWLEEITYPDKSREHFDYDDNGLLTGITSGDEYTALAYDDDGWLRGVQFPDQPYLWAQRDSVGTLLSIGLDDTPHAQYTYNAQGQITALRDAAGDLIAGYEYHANGLLAAQINANGTRTRYTYEESNLVRIETLSPDGETLAYRTYAYDSKGRVSSMETEEGLWVYAYDALNQLIAETAPNGTHTQYAYDALGSRMSVTVDGAVIEYQSNITGQYERVGELEYTYDGNGRVTRVSGPDGDTEITYNAKGYMTSLIAPGMEYAFEYDVFGARTSMTLNGQTTGALQSPFRLSQVLMTWNELAEWPEEAKEEAQGERSDYTAFFWGPFLAAQAQQDELYSYGLDILGSVMTLTDSEAQPAGEDVYNPFGYVGGFGVQDDGNGLYYMRARMYWEPTGSFLTPDPAGQAAFLQPYVYANNSPTLYIDPTGETSILIAAAGGAVLKMIPRLAVDLATGNLSSWPEYAGDAIGGAIGGAASNFVGIAAGQKIAGFVSTVIGSVLGDLVNGERDTATILKNLGMKLTLHAALDAVAGKLVNDFIKDRFLKGAGLQIFKGGFFDKYIIDPILKEGVKAVPKVGTVAGRALMELFGAVIDTAVVFFAPELKNAAEETEEETEEVTPGSTPDFPIPYDPAREDYKPGLWYEDQNGTPFLNTGNDPSKPEPMYKASDFEKGRGRPPQEGEYAVFSAHATWYEPAIYDGIHLQDSFGYLYDYIDGWVTGFVIYTNGEWVDQYDILEMFSPAEGYYDFFCDEFR